MSDFKYRPDVDGLRAVAVILVLLFHAGLGFSGGFIGVDVFFVISGFLITGLILKEQEAGKFSLANFWVRRIRRIIPAATVMVIAVLMAGYCLLLPSDFADLGKSTMAQQLMFANVYFWQNMGYFDGPADLKPLLHTWSLAVEEQFYLGYPFLLMLLHRFGRRVTLIVLATIAIGSLGVSQYAASHYPSAAFFLLPTRAWELLIGGLICFLPRPSRIKPWILASLSWTSLAAILAAAWFYSSSTLFPGFSALVPCVASAVLIYANSSQLSVPAAVLASRPMVFIGLISYSLYLWHWPIFAYARYFLGNDLDLGVRLLAIFVSIVIAIISRKYVETPVRTSAKSTSAVPAIFGALASACLLIAASYWVKDHDGLAERLPERVRKAAQRMDDGQKWSVSIREIQSGELPVLGVPAQKGESPDFIVWGDSHAMALGSCFDEVARNNHLSGVIAARPGTVPILGVWRPGFKEGSASEAPQWNQSVLEFVRQSKIKNVILVARWDVNIDGELNGGADKLIAEEDEMAATVESAKMVMGGGLCRTLDELEEAGARVWILKTVPLQRSNPQLAVVRSLWYDFEIPKGVSIEEHEERQRNANTMIDSQVHRRQRSSAVDLSTAFFEADGRSLLGSSQGSFYRDDDHVSGLGALELIRPILDPVLADIGRASMAERQERGTSLGERKR